MSDTGDVFLGIIAVATLVTSIIQVGAIVAMVKLAGRLERLVGRVEQDLRPIFVQAAAISRDASRIAALTVTQVERVDRLLTDVTRRAEAAMHAIEAGIAAPAREGRAVLSGIRAALAAIRELRASGRVRGSRTDEEDALFI